MFPPRSHPNTGELPVAAPEHPGGLDVGAARATLAWGRHRARAAPRSGKGSVRSERWDLVFAERLQRGGAEGRMLDYVCVDLGGRLLQTRNAASEVAWILSDVFVG